MRKSIRISALSLIAAAMIGASAGTAAASPGGGEGPQINACGNTSQEAEAEHKSGQLVGQSNDGHHPAFCQTGFGNTITNINPDINVYINVPETGEAPQ